MIKPSESRIENGISIVLIGTQMAIGGAQKLLLEQANWFVAHGHKVTVVFFYDRDGLHEKWQKKYSFQIKNLNSFDNTAGGVGKFKKLLVGLWNLWKILRQGNFDAIITFTHDSNMLGLPMAWLAGIPARVGTHLGEIRGMSAWRERVHTALVNYGIIQILVASSSRTRENAIRCGVQPERIKVIYNAVTPMDLSGVDRNSIRNKLNLQEDDIFLLSVGRLVYEKGHEFLVKAMSSVSRAQQHVVAGICGSGPLYNQLNEEISNLRLEKRVKLLGQWENLPELLASADIFILPSRWEGLPIALLEAMSVGLPVIAAMVEGVDEVIVEGEHGLLVPIENPDALAEAILQLVHDPLMRKQMGEASEQRLLDLYSIDRMGTRYLSLMLELTGSKAY